MAARCARCVRRPAAVRVEAGARPGAPGAGGGARSCGRLSWRTTAIARQAARPRPGSRRPPPAALRCATCSDAAALAARGAGAAVARARARGAADARAGERHLHAHFAGGAALDAMRVGRLLGLPYSVTAARLRHLPAPAQPAREARARGLRVDRLRLHGARPARLVGPPGAERIHEIVMGVDGERFRRRGAAYPGGAHGRGGRAAGREEGLRAPGRAPRRDRRRPLERLVIVGDGPAARRARGPGARARARGRVVELAGPVTPDEVRALLEQADVLAMPCVVAADGDRDSMPVVVKEALAMEVPVVADRRGRAARARAPRVGPARARPRDPAALAAALAELLGAAPASSGPRWAGPGRAFVPSASTSAARRSSSRPGGRRRPPMSGAAAPPSVLRLPPPSIGAAWTANWAPRRSSPPVASRCRRGARRWRSRCSACRRPCCRCRRRGVRPRFGWATAWCCGEWPGALRAPRAASPGRSGASSPGDGESGPTCAAARPPPTSSTSTARARPGRCASRSPRSGGSASRWW